MLLEGHHGNVAVLDQAMHSLDTVSMAPAERATLIQRILSTALPLVKANPPKRGTMIGTYPATESGLRTGIEDSYRILARESTDPNERIRLVNQANAQRNWSLT